MKTARPANHNSFESRRRGKVVDLWRSFGEPKVGADELRQIETALATEFAAAKSDISPATIARVLADEGAELRHPEIIEFDAHWREAQIKRDAERFNGLEKMSPAGPMSRTQAEALINELERLRQRLSGEADREALNQLTTLAASARRTAQSLAKDRTSDSARRAEQAEIAEWLKVWIQTPKLFGDWLELRKGSLEFRKRFGSGE